MVWRGTGEGGREGGLGGLGKGRQGEDPRNVNAFGNVLSEGVWAAASW